MSHTVRVGEFEGPLGALLELVERQKLAVSAISVAQITTQYIDYVRSLTQNSAEDLSEFIQLGARLLYIKSLALLPQESRDQQTAELEQLSLELAEYRRFQTAARTLASLTANRTWTKPATRSLSQNQFPLTNLKLEQLAAAFAAVLNRTPPAERQLTVTPHLSLETVTRRLRALLPASFQLGTIISQCQDRLEVIVTFLALLELIRGGVARVTQASQFQPILVEPAHAKI